MATSSKGVIKCGDWRPVVEEVALSRASREDKLPAGTFSITFIFCIQAKLADGKTVKITLPEMHQNHLKYDQKKDRLMVQGSDDGSKKKHWLLKVQNMSLKDGEFTSEERLALKNGDKDQNATDLTKALNAIFSSTSLVAVDNDKIFSNRKQLTSMSWKQWLGIKDKIRYYAPSAASEFSDSDGADNANSKRGKQHKKHCINITCICSNTNYVNYLVCQNIHLVCIIYTLTRPCQYADNIALFIYSINYVNYLIF
jgi:hypothetical protein